MTKRIFDPNFTVWSYERPNGSVCARMRNIAPMVTEWSFAPISECKNYYDLNKTKSGFPTEEAALKAAKENV